MAEEIELEITETGGIRMLHHDAVDLSEFGKQTVVRASHVEYYDGKFSSDEYGRFGTMAVGWYVQSAATLDVLKSGIESRGAALAWEKQHYSPTGKGWAELTQGGN